LRSLDVGVDDTGKGFALVKTGLLVAVRSGQGKKATREARERGVGQIVGRTSVRQGGKEEKG
jgi:hypothetical protein